MQQSILVKPGDLTGSVRVPLSKSLLHRSLICAAMAGDLSLCDLGEDALSDDIAATKDCLGVIMDAKKMSDKRFLSLSCQESGSTLRFLVPFVAALGISAHISGEGRLPMRPLGEFAAIFEGKGVRMDFPDDGRYLPLVISGKLKPGIFLVPGNISSQYISGLLMALPLLEDDSEIHLLTALESEPYVEMTRDCLLAFGVIIQKTASGYYIRGQQSYSRSRPYRAEPDFSQAAFWLSARYLGHNISVLDLPQHSSQGDQEILQLLIKLQKASHADAKTDSSGKDVYLEVDVSNIPDLVPIFAVAAAATCCVTRITHAQRLRLKECDRLHATFDLLTRLGSEVNETNDGLIIYGRTHLKGAKGVLGKAVFKGCKIDSFHDHRMVMAAAIAATRADGPVCISDFRAVDKSYPDFFRDFRMAGGTADELNMGE